MSESVGLRRGTLEKREGRHRENSLITKMSMDLCHPTSVSLLDESSLEGSPFRNGRSTPHTQSSDMGEG